MRLLIVIVAVVTISPDINNGHLEARNTRTDSITQNDLHQLLTGDRYEYQQFPIRYIPMAKLNPDSWHQAQLTKSQIYDSQTIYPKKHSFNHLISSDNIEAIINENDATATAQWIDGFKKELSHSMNVPDRFYQLQRELGGKRNLSLEDRTTDEVDLNGFDTAYYHADPRQGATRSTGTSGQYFSIQKHCAQLKDCNVYPMFRVLHKSQPLSCEDIMTQLLPQVYECVDKYGADDCPLHIDSGYFRHVFKVQIPDTNEYVTLKIQRADKMDDWARDLQRNVRESIFLYYLQQEEMEYIERNGALFVSNGEPRAFPYVRELGHCVYPTYMSVSPYYNLTLEYYIKSGLAAAQPISKLLRMALDMAKATEAMHNIRGGPFHHTDVGIDQYMMDDEGHVLLNDFNRGKFQSYRFAANNTVKCTYCPYEAEGRNRAPEEFDCEPLDASVDVHSTALTIWSLFSGTRAWTKPMATNTGNALDSGESLAFADVTFVVHKTIRKPKMPYNIPYALQGVIRWAMTHDPRERPTATQFRRAIQDIVTNVNKYTRNRGNMVSGKARAAKLFKDHHYPKVPNNFPACCLNIKTKQKKKKHL
eukprot:398620_1